MVNYYEVLGLDGELQGDMISKELTRIQRTWQSRTNAPSLEKRQEAETLLKIAIEAKEILIDPKAREKYDKQLDKQKEGSGEKIHIDMADNVDDMIDQIKDQIGNNNISNALLLAKKASLQAPNNHQVVSYLGYCYWRMGQLEEAIREYETAIALSSDVLEYYYDLIYIHLDNDNSNAAENYLKMVREMEPNNKDFLRIETLLLNRKGLYGETIKIIENIMKDHQLDRNNGTDVDLLCDYVDAKEAEAFSYYDKGNDSYYYLTDLDKLDRVKEIWHEIERYKFVYNDPSYVDGEIEKLDSLYEKKFKNGGKKLFIIPGIITALGIFGESMGLAIIGILLVGGIAYFVPEPQWKINRSIILGQKSPVDYAISVNNGIFKLGSVLGVVFLAITGFFVSMIFRSNDRY